MPGKITSDSGVFCKTNITWNSGWRASDRAGCKRLDDSLERHVLVGVRVEGKRSHPAHQLSEAGIAGKVDADHQRVDEEAHEVFQFPSHRGRRRRYRSGCRRRRPDVQNSGEARLKDHEQAGAAGVGQFQEAAVQLGIEAHGHGRPAVAGDGRPRAIEGEAQFVGNTGELRPPERELARQRVVGPSSSPSKPRCHKV